MAESSTPRSGRSWVDWEQAFLFYASLPPGQRTYAAVATEFAVSPRTVETHGRNEQWKARLRAIRRDASSRTHQALVDARVEEIEKLRRLIDASLDEYADALRSGMRMSPADLERLNRLSRTLIEEIGASSEINDAGRGQPSERTIEHASAVLEALAEAGALEALGLTRIPMTQTDPGKEEEAENEHR